NCSAERAVAPTDDVQGELDMKKQWVLAGIFVSLLAATSAMAQHTAPNQQPPKMESPSAPPGEVALGSVTIPRPVTADGKPLAAGTYQLKLTAQEAAPPAVGTTKSLERWGEVSQRGSVKGRGGGAIVPQSGIKMGAEEAPPAS